MGVKKRKTDADLAGTAETLETAYDAERRVAALTIDDREAILRVLEECPEGLPSCAACCSASTSGACGKVSPNQRRDDPFARAMQWCLGIVLPTNGGFPCGIGCR